METYGYIRHSFRESGKNFLMLEVEELPTASPDRVTVKITKTKKKRSLTANAYHWQLCNKMAAVLRTSDAEVHHTLMLRYGTLLTDKDDMPVIVALSQDVDMVAMNMYGRLVSSGDLNHYVLIKPSRYYDSGEMARLIEGTIDEAKALGIETLTPHELEQMGLLGRDKKG